jgi:hypothetical protein
MFRMGLTCQGHCKEVESIPSPTQKAAKEHGPLMLVELFDNNPGIVELCAWRLQRRDS